MKQKMGVSRGVKVQEGNPLNSKMAEDGRRKAFGVSGWEADGAGNEGDRWRRWRRRRIVRLKGVEVPNGRAAVSGGPLGPLGFCSQGASVSAGLSHQSLRRRGFESHRCHHMK